MKTLLLLTVGAMAVSPAFAADLLEAAPQQAKVSRRMTKSA